MAEKPGIKSKLESLSDELIDTVMEELVEKATKKLSTAKGNIRETSNRLIQLDECHYFDTQDKVVLLKDGSQFKNIRCAPVYLKRSADRIREEARKSGFVSVESGSFWNPQTKHLYVINGERFVLYALDRRKTVRKRRVGDATPESIRSGAAPEGQSGL
jgi:hypothetical protein